MEFVLQASMNEEYDNEFGKVKGLILQREKILAFLFQIYDYLLIAMTKPVPEPTVMQRVAAADAAMQNVLSNGGRLGQAMQTFDSYAAVNHARVVQINNNLSVEYGLADSNVQSCFNSDGNLTVVNGINPCIANLENNSTNSDIINITSVQPTDQNGNVISTFTRGQSGYVKVSIYFGYSTPSLVTINLFGSNLNTLGTSSIKYTLNPSTSQVILPYYVPTQSKTGLASIYANVLTDWPNKGGTSESHEQSYFVGLL